MVMMGWYINNANRNENYPLVTTRALITQPVNDGICRTNWHGGATCLWEKKSLLHNQS